MSFADDSGEFPIIADPTLTEYFKGAACSSGQTATVLKALYPVIDFSNCSERWSDGSESLEEFEARITHIKRTLADREEKVVAVMTHGWLIGQMLKKNKMPFFADFAIVHFDRETLNITIVHDYILKGKVWRM